MSDIRSSKYNSEDGDNSRQVLISSFGIECRSEVAGDKGGEQYSYQWEEELFRGSESSAQTTSTAISCFFNKRKQNVIVLFVSTFKNTILVLIPGSKSRETK